MARIRTLKPEFWADEKLAPLPPITRLVFLGLISQADDAGRLVDNVRLIDGLLFPETEESSRESLDTLASLQRVIRYTSRSGQRLIQIVNWEEHQKVDRPSKYVLPPPPPEALAAPRHTAHSRDTRETLATGSRDPIVPTYDLRPTTYDLGAEGSGSEDRATASDIGDWLGEYAAVMVGFRARPGNVAREEHGLFGLFVDGPTAEGRWKTPDGSRVPPAKRPELFANAMAEFTASGSRFTPSTLDGFLRSTIRRWKETGTAFSQDDEHARTVAAMKRTEERFRASQASNGEAA